MHGFARRMAQAIQSRGPDDAGTWTDDSSGVALAHRRLAILDLSAAGHQPMESACGRYVIVFNGEIYNHLELRARLESAGRAPIWRGHSDTETFLAAISAWGLTATLRSASGMFAIGLWDKSERRLILAKDRFGEKPLYYGWQGSTFLFGSELKALREHPAWSAVIDQGALTLFMRYGYVPTPHTIWQGLQKLPPGCWIEIPRDTLSGSLPSPIAYWSTVDCMRDGRAQHFVDEQEAIESLEHVLSAAVARQCAADVPLGAFLSGGVDSSIVVAMMQQHAQSPVRTFAIGFEDGNYDEAKYAAQVANHLGTNHTELYVSSTQARAVIPDLPHLYDEPFADSSQIPTFLVSKLARQHVTVALSGDGGDELFGGYNRYAWGSALWRRMQQTPMILRRGAAIGLQALSPATWDRLYTAMLPFIPEHRQIRRAGDQIHKLANAIDAASPEELYLRLVSQQQAPMQTVRNGVQPPTWVEQELARLPGLPFVEYMMLADQLGYLSDDILTKVDRAAMGVSLETRVPILDPAVVSLAWRVPQSMKLRNGQGKWLLRQVLYRHVPPALIERPKTGFGIPLGDWLRNDLREWAESLIAPDRLRAEGLLDADKVWEQWQRHLSGCVNQSYWLWNVLMFQAWKERWV